MALTFYWYPKCGTCQKAKKWLDEYDIEYHAIHIVDKPPTKDDILNFFSMSDVPPKKFFNTSGKKYRELNMKEKIKDASQDELADYLASDGMLIKRPIVTNGEKITVGYHEETFEATWLNQ